MYGGRGGGRGEGDAEWSSVRGEMERGERRRRGSAVLIRAQVVRSREVQSLPANIAPAPLAVVGSQGTRRRGSCPPWVHPDTTPEARLAAIDQLQHPKGGPAHCHPRTKRRNAPTSCESDARNHASGTIRTRPTASEPDGHLFLIITHSPAVHTVSFPPIRPSRFMVNLVPGFINVNAVALHSRERMQYGINIFAQRETDRTIMRAKERKVVVLPRQVCTNSTRQREAGNNMAQDRVSRG